MREAIRHMDEISKQVRLISKYNLKTDVDVHALIDRNTEAMKQLKKERDGCYKRLRRYSACKRRTGVMLANGVQMKQIQDWLGHSTFATTADIYSHLDYKSKEESASVMSALLK